MQQRNWMIIGATSIIAEQFAHVAASARQGLILVGRDAKQLTLIAADIRLRHQVNCDVLQADLADECSDLLKYIEQYSQELDICLAHSLQLTNEELNTNNIRTLTTINISSTLQIIHSYWHRKQKSHRLLFISSVAACRGRKKNSLYGASKAAVEVYLQGLQQSATPQQHITIARLGFIDTHVTYGQPGIFYAASPQSCANYCWRAIQAKKPLVYFPFFWRYIMLIITKMPFYLYKRVNLG